MLRFSGPTVFILARFGPKCNLIISERRPTYFESVSHDDSCIRFPLNRKLLADKRTHRYKQTNKQTKTRVQTVTTTPAKSAPHRLSPGQRRLLVK